MVNSLSDFSYLAENMSFFATKLTKAKLFECKIDKRFKIKNCVDSFCRFRRMHPVLKRNAQLVQSK